MSLSIAIVTPSYNQGKFIERTIQSVLSQNIENLDYLICDGGSTDETVDILRQYETRIRWLSEPDGGQADAVNKGIQQTAGDIIGWLNSDDIYCPHALNYVQEYFEKQPHVDIIYGRANHIDSEDNFLEPYPTAPWNYEQLKEACFICQPAVFFRRRVVEEYGALDPTLQYCMDYEYWLRLGRTCTFAYVDQVLAGSRLYESNKTLGSRLAVHHEIVMMTKQLFGKTPDRWIFNYAHVLADQKGYNRETATGRIKYVLWLLVLSTISFLRWNHSLPKTAVNTMWQWITKPLYHSLREVLSL